MQNKGMKVCIVSFSKRSGGNCAGIAKELYRLYGDGARVYDFSELEVIPCGGCDYECFDSAEKCPRFSDSAFQLYDEITNSDLAYFIVPNYCDYPCSAFFAFNERSQCYFQKRQDRLEKYLSVKKKFIAVSNTNRENFTAAFRYQIQETEEPDTLFLEAKRFHKVSIRGDLMESEEAKEAIVKFAKSYEYERDITLELLTDNNIEQVRKIQRDDISTDFADDADTIMEITQYGIDHNCIGDTYAVKYKSEYIGLILLGEAIPWETDPPEMKKTPFYRLMGFVIDKRYRSMGIGSYVLEKVIDTCCKKYGTRPVALGCHRDNVKAAEFYQKHGFIRTEYMEGSDRYYLRYPQNPLL